MFCPKCNTENRDSANFCDNCGTKFQKDHENALVEQEESKLPLMKIAAAIIAVAVILLLLFFVLNRGPAPKQGSALSTTALQSTTTTVIFSASNGTEYSADLRYNSNMILAGNIATTGNVVIKSGVTLTTDGYSIIAGGTFNNSGTVDAGNTGDAASLGSNGQSYPDSFGGSGGSGGGGNSGKGASGSTPQSPTLSGVHILAWYKTGFVNYLTGAGGGGACNLNGYAGNGGSTIVPGGNLSYSSGRIPCDVSGNSQGASGSYGVYIQANEIIAGTINANGQQAYVGKVDAGGGGGGGVIILAYSIGYVPGIYNVSGGPAQQDSGAGGSGQIWRYIYGLSPPIAP